MNTSPNHCRVCGVRIFNDKGEIVPQLHYHPIISTTCEYPLLGSLCGAIAKFRGKTTGNSYCQDHGNLIKRWATEELIPI